jgi:hypothetical protein
MPPERGLGAVLVVIKVTMPPERGLGAVLDVAIRPERGLGAVIVVIKVTIPAERRIPTSERRIRRFSPATATSHATNMAGSPPPTSSDCGEPASFLRDQARLDDLASQPDR